MRPLSRVSKSADKSALKSKSSSCPPDVPLVSVPAPLAVLTEDKNEDDHDTSNYSSSNISSSLYHSSSVSILQQLPQPPPHPPSPIISVSSSSPSTPPKKVWERSYRNFLKLRKHHHHHHDHGQQHDHSQTSQPPPPPPTTTTTSSPSVMHLFPSHRRAKSYAAPSSHSSVSSSPLDAPVSAAAAAVAASAGSSVAAVSTKEDTSVRGGKLFAHMFSSSSSTSTSSSLAPAATSTSDLHSNTNTATSTSIRKSKSLSGGGADELDGTMRRGSEKAYSPGNARYLIPISATTGPSSSTLSSAPLPPPPPTTTAMRTTNLEVIAAKQPHTPQTLTPSAMGSSLPTYFSNTHGGGGGGGGSILDNSAFYYNPSTSVFLRPRSEVFRQSSDRGVPPATTTATNATTTTTATADVPPRVRLVIAQEQPSSSSSSLLPQQQQVDVAAQSSSTMKKFFTEFHNSSSTGRDAFSPYLGDDPSHHTNSKSNNNISSSNNFNNNAEDTPQGQQQQSISLGNNNNNLKNNDPTTDTASSMLGPNTELQSAPAAPAPWGVENSQGHLSFVSSVSAPTPSLSALSSKLFMAAMTTTTTQPQSPTSVSTTSMNHHQQLASAAIGQKIATTQSSTSSNASTSTNTNITRTTLLKPLQSVEEWRPGRRYLIAPAALAACTKDGAGGILTSLAPGPWKSPRQVFMENSSGASNCFGTIYLGRCLLTMTTAATSSSTATTFASTGIAPPPPPPTAASTSSISWSSDSILLLKQNYLLEYDSSSSSFLRGSSSSSEYHDNLRNIQPRGYAHLQYATCELNNERGGLTLQFFGSPCAKCDPRILHIQILSSEGEKRSENQVDCSTIPATSTSTTTANNNDNNTMVDEREAWKWCLNRAAKLDIEDLYEYCDVDDYKNFNEKDQKKTGVEINQRRTRPVLLGKGGCACVYAGRRRNDDDDNNRSRNRSQYCALKVFDKNEYWRMVVKGRERADTLVREISVQATMTSKCKNIPSFVRLRGFFETADQVVLELELLEEGIDLFKYISARGVLKEASAAKILYDILHALEAMNRIGLAHRDVKPANVLMMSSSSPTLSSDTKKKNQSRIKDSPSSRPLCKLADFGMSTFVGADGLLRGRCGTPGYVAPEIFTAGVHGGYGNKVDVFSAGVTLYVMLCGYEPFYGETDAELVAANKAAKIDFPEEDWKNISLQARDLVQKMMNPDPQQRLSPSEALNHAWLDQVRTSYGATGTYYDLDRGTAKLDAEVPSEDSCSIF